MPWARLPTPLRLLLLTALCTSTTSALPASRIFAREDTCGADRVSCNSDLTDLFCCPKDYSCILLAGGTSAMCCPAGRNCNEVKPITCDRRGQDITKYPKAPVMTIITNLKLEECGTTMCCPFGYSCEGDSKCVLNKDQSSPPEGAEYPSGTSSAAPSATSPTSSETASASAEPTSTSEPSKASDENQKEDPEEEEKKDSGPATTSIVGGVVGGCIILLIIAVVIFLYFRRQKKREGGHGEKGGHFYGGGGSTSSSEASFGNFISEPIVQPNSYRADFILKTPSQNSQVSGGSSSVPQSQFSGAHSQFSGASSSVPQRQFSMSPTPTRVPQGPPRIRISIPNPFDSPNPSPNHHKSAQMSPTDDTPVRHGTVRLPPIRAMKASSQISRRPDSPDLQREPSCESINVFADPSDVVKPRRLTRGTTFTDLMDEADLRGVGRGKAYAPGTKPHVPGTTPRI